MGAPRNSWKPLGGDGDRALDGGGFRIRARIQARPDEVWLNVEQPDGSWSYVVLRDGEVVANAHAESKRKAYTRAIKAVAHAPSG